MPRPRSFDFARQSFSLLHRSVYPPGLHLLRKSHQPVGLLIERAHEPHQVYGVGIVELLRQLSQVDTGLQRIVDH